MLAEAAREEIPLPPRQSLASRLRIECDLHSRPWEATTLGHETMAFRRYDPPTGFCETSINAIDHHDMAVDGPPCTACGTFLRMPRASFCAGCVATAPSDGHGS
jgi:hypothetical protein